MSNAHINIYIFDVDVPYDCIYLENIYVTSMSVSVFVIFLRIYLIDMYEAHMGIFIIYITYIFGHVSDLYTCYVGD